MTSSHRSCKKDKCINETSPRCPEWMAGALFFINVVLKIQEGSNKILILNFGYRKRNIYPVNLFRNCPY